MPKYSYFTVLCLGTVLSLSWLCNAIVIRVTGLLYLPLAARFLFGAITLFFIPAIFLRRFPQSSLRLLHAALSVSALTYFMAPLLAQVALKTLPSASVALVMCTVPIWLALLVKGISLDRFPDLFLLFLGVASFFVGVWPLADERGNPGMAMLLLGLACFCQVMGIWLSRRLFWLHSALDLNFWAMALAGGAHLVLALLQAEPAQLVTDRSFFPTYGIVAFVGFVCTGAAAYLYRVESITRNTLVVLTMLVPTMALVFAAGAMGETPINAFTMVGLLITLFALGKECLKGIPAHWMTLLLNNDRRQGDRLVCLLDGFMRRQGDPQTFRIQVIDLSIGGIGFRLDKEANKGETVLVTLPMGKNWTSITLEGRITHSVKTGGREYPFGGGIEFLNLSGHRRQCVVEFLARVSRAEEEPASSLGA